jgi:tetratricopeptide (TPR) repeat protein
VTPERYEQVQEIFLSVCECELAERSRLLEQACGSDVTLRADVERLLSADSRGHGILVTAETPAGSSAAVGLGQFESIVGGATRPPSLPERIGRYAIRGILGEGGMGVVYLAEQDSPRREVALKLIRPGFASQQLLRRLEHEAQLLGRLQHPGIAQIFEAGTADTNGARQPFFAMELIRGKPITEYVRTAGLDIRARLRLFVKVCEAVEHAHQKGVIHRDLKPGNILVTDAGQPKILDFGVARAIDSDIQTTTLQTDVGQLVGTLPYMSPEQVHGDPALLDTRSDIYALGVLSYELLAGRLPYDFTGKSIPESLRVIDEGRPASLSSISRVLRGDLETIIVTALEKDPDRRYQTASALADDVRRYLNSEPIRARPPSAAYQMRKFAARHKAPVSLALLLMIVTAAFGVVASVQAVRSAHQRDVALAAQRRETEARQSAEQVIEFLVNLFEQGDPDAPREQIPSVPDVLEAGVSRVETELDGQPLVQARLMNVLGSVYRNLGEFERARELLESAVTVQRRELGDDHPDLAESLILLARVHTMLGEHDQADELLSEAFEIRRRRFGETHALVAEALEQRGSNRFYARDYAAAAEYFRDSLAMREQLYGREHLEVASSLSNLGSALGKLGEIEEAEDLLREGVATRRALLGDDFEVALTLDNLAHVVFARGDYAEAEGILKEELDLTRRLLHENHPRIAFALNNYAFLVKKNHGFKQAEPLYREALAIRRAAYGDEHPEVANALNELGMVRLELGDFEEAAALLREALSIRRAQFGDRNDQVAYALRNLAEAYLRANSFEDAEPLLLESVETFTANHGEQYGMTKNTIQALITLYEQWGKPDQAAEWRAKSEADPDPARTEAAHEAVAP